MTCICSVFFSIFQISLAITGMNAVCPVFFKLISLLELYHPRVALYWELTRYYYTAPFHPIKVLRFFDLFWTELLATEELRSIVLLLFRYSEDSISPALFSPLERPGTITLTSHPPATKVYLNRHYRWLLGDSAEIFAVLRCDGFRDWQRYS